jgi:hypothetical protein
VQAKRNKRKVKENSEKPKKDNLINKTEPKKVAPKTEQKPKEKKNEAANKSEKKPPKKQDYDDAVLAKCKYYLSRVMDTLEKFKAMIDQKDMPKDQKLQNTKRVSTVLWTNLLFTRFK